MDLDPSQLINMSAQVFPPNQQQHFRPANRSRFPQPPLPPNVNSHRMNPGESYGHPIGHSPWSHTDSNNYPVPPPPPPPPQIPHSTAEDEQRKVLTSKLFQKNQLIPVESFLLTD